ncbi:unnamed protein product [Rhodiola kirilowii]
MFNSIHHDIGTHVSPPPLSSNPHYHLREATIAAKPVLESITESQASQEQSQSTCLRC